MTHQSDLRAHRFYLADQDRAAIAKIRECMQLDSGALAVRLAIRDLAKRLDAGQPEGQEADPVNVPASANIPG